MAADPNDDELASVRIEVDATTSGAPQVEAVPAGPPKWVFAAAPLAALMVIFALLFIRPSGDEAADGTERVDPTATTEPALIIEDPEESPPETASSSEPAAVNANVVYSGNGVSELVRADIGFLALSWFSEDAGPQMLRSLDGIDWFELETTVEIPADLGLEVAPFSSWFGLRRTDTGFSISGEVLEAGGAAEGEASGLRVFVSTDGVSWQLADSGPGPDGFGFLIPISQRDGSIFYQEFLGDPDLAEVLQEHTSLDLGGVPVCDVNGDSGQFLVAPCQGDEIELSENLVDSDLPPAQIFGCLGSLGNRFNFTSRIVRFDLESGELDTVPESETSWGFSDQVDLGPGSIASIDVATDIFRGPGLDRAVDEGAAACAGVIELDDGREASLVVLDTNTLAVSRSPLPVRAELGVAAVLGELLSEDGEESRILVRIGDELWLFDMDRDSWVDLAIAVRPADSGLLASTALAESGSRIYHLTDELTVIDLSIEPDGTVSVAESSTPMRLDPETFPVGFQGGNIVFATNEVVFFADFDNESSLLRIEVPQGAG